MADDFTPLRIAVMTSHGAPGLEFALGHEHRRALFDIVGVLTSEKTFTEIAAVEAAGIPVIVRPLRSNNHDHAFPLRNLHAREDYDAESAHLLKELRADYVLMLGYNYIVTAPLIETFPQRLIAFHDGDLLLRDENGTRRYSGLHAVREAVFAGEPETRSSAFFVTEEVGAGPLFLVSPAYRVAPLARDARDWGAADLLSEYADLHRRWMLRGAWGEMFVRTMEFLAAGTLTVVKDLVFIDGVPGPCRLGEAPGVCRDLESTIANGIPASCPLLRS